MKVGSQEHLASIQVPWIHGGSQASYILVRGGAREELEGPRGVHTSAFHRAVNFAARTCLVRITYSISARLSY